ncbi:MAG: sugar phosphate isomerase/epimerase [Kiritimatiellae bacterium]|nr:sugar phosphate isomerase/epimerase [Kiritimatiellia bacterium]
MRYIALNGWIYCGFGGERKPREFIDWAAAKGLDGVELTVGDCLPADTSEAEAKELAAYAKTKGVGLRTLAAGAGWGKWLTSGDPAERAEAVAFAKKYLQLASWLGVETVLTVPGATRVAWDASHAEVSYGNAWGNAAASIREIAPVAESLGVNLALENVWNRFLVSPMEWKFFLDQIGSKRVGLYFDVGNCCLNTNPADWPEILGDRIKAVHLKNFAESDSAGGLHGFGDDLFNGVVDFKRLFAALDAAGYAGPFTVEMIPFSRLPDLVMPDAALADKVAGQIKELKSLP